MTDGIVQKVLNPEIDFWSKQKSLCASVLNTELSRIRQELIEEIKKLGQDYDTEFEGYHLQSIPIQELIGDNE